MDPQKFLNENSEYIDQLLSQGDGNLNICPDCFESGVRKFCCKNLVVLRVPETVLVCCYLGDKHELTRKAFRKKVKELKKAK